MDTVSDEISEQVVAEEPVQQEGETDLAKTPPTASKELAQAPEQTPEQPEQLEPPAPAPKRVRKVRVVPPKETAPQHTPNPDYWRSRLQEHRGNQRAAKSERYGNLRIM